MTKRIVYAHRGDLVEIRVCPDYDVAAATPWKAQIRSHAIIIGVEAYDRITVPEMGCDVFLGLSKKQLMTRP